MKFDYDEFKEQSLEKLVNFFSNTKQVVLLFLILLTVATAVFFNLNKNKENQIEQEKNKGQRIPSTIAYFRTPVEDIRVRTEVKLKYKMPKDKQGVWFGFDPIEGVNRPVILVNHPMFDNLDWDKVENKEYTLFQKNKNYNSVEEFLTNPPMDKKIAADTAIYEYGILQLPNVNKITDTYVLTEDDEYILTTFHYPYRDRDWLVFDRTMDTTDAAIEEDKMTWHLELSGVSEENPFFMNGVEINFSQPGQIVEEP